ncbi:CDC27 family protein [uncultured Tenacibaculum sp.]|uniref:tetratricopeptide repeat protein n=1 Tax=uncultured Tenacibaculum sp. TaxID=174713 RepID=UPI00260B32EA|nr:CDC27 family protein [uncultured Tenacibaculum sp.]
MGLEDDILIERFLRSELSDEERNQFLKRLDIDEVFKEQFIIEKQLFESLNEESWSFIENLQTKEIEEYTQLFRSEEGVRMKKTFSEVNDIYKKENKVKKRRVFYISGIAAAVLLLLTLNLYNGSDSTNYYSDYIMMNELPSFVDRSETTDKQDLVAAESYFKEKKYEEALSVLNKVSSPELKDGNYYVYKAIALMELNKYKEAETTLNSLINSDLLDAPKGYWYKALLFVKSKETEKAKKELNTLIAKSDYKQKEAKELLEKLE